MSSRVLVSTALVAAALAAGCKEQAPIPHTPDSPDHRLGRQISRVTSRRRLRSPLVVQALDGANRSVAGVPVTWTVTGGGAVSAATSTTDNDGKATVTWTLAPATGVQVVTVTSTQISSASVSFVANNGAVDQRHGDLTGRDTVRRELLAHRVAVVESRARTHDHSPSVDEQDRHRVQERPARTGRRRVVELSLDGDGKADERSVAAASRRRCRERTV